MSSADRSRLQAILDRPRAQAEAEVRARFLAVHGPGALRIVLWGAGPLATMVLAGLHQAGQAPLAVCDRNPDRWHSSFEGLEVLPPAVAVERFGQSAVFVPAVYTNGDLLAELRSQGLRALPLAVLAWQFPESLLPHCALALPETLHEDADQVLAALDLWADPRSRQEYLGQVQWRANLDASMLAQPLPAEAMFAPTDLMAFLAEEHFVDCGAFDGDTLRNHLRHHPRGTGTLTAIEPDPQSFQKLQGWISTLEAATTARIRPVQAALGHTPGSISFCATGSVVSCAGQAGTVQVRQERLDQLEPALGATFLKMDIEGAEVAALEGARGILLDSRPVLAICLYHRTEDLWRIPLQIRAICPDYRFFLRRYSDECWEQVCYAIPPARLLAAATSR